ncbi:SigE family RNA polymerase sigma factor [Kineosporia sp. R_H_3]|uniref:SigE family RNA polymerase sigma factor n=1 Tax=Kineosporia sp. R_H_3 TaxID=1961848 RepID=UPI000B4B577E|nr:SigE family RNA polymerase sigma factor [Kineosporia sp. R_H_3]
MLGRRSAADGAEESFRAFVVARRPALLRTAWLLTGSRDDAEDLVQTALVRAARHWARVVAAGDPEPYVRRVLVTVHVSAWRTASRRVVTTSLEGQLDGSPDGSPDVLLDGPADRRSGDSTSVDDRLVLAAALARLTPRQRAVLVLRFYEDLTETQTAAALGIGVGTVKSQTRHALARLRDVAPELAVFAPARTPDHEEVTS